MAVPCKKIITQGERTMYWKRKPKTIEDDGTEIIRYEAEDMPLVAIESCGREERIDDVKRVP